MLTQKPRARIVPASLCFYVPGQCGMGFRGIQLLLDDAGPGRVKTKKPRLEAGRDEALVEPEAKVIVLVGHLVRRGPGYSRVALAVIRSLVGGGR